jgi:hypothetical protein
MLIKSNYAFKSFNPFSKECCMMSRKIAVAAVALCGMMFIAGCEKAPQQDMDNAKAALEGAKTAEADKYAADKFQAAQTAYDNAMSDIKAQDAKSSFSRKYDSSKKLLLEAATAANAAKEAAASGKATMTTEVAGLIAQAKTAVDDVKKTVDAAKKQKKDVAALSAQIDAAAASLTQAETSMTNGDVIGAKVTVTQVMAQAMTIKADVEKLVPAKAAGKGTPIVKAVKALKK